MNRQTNLAELRRRFPLDFVWGVATSAFQIEGAARADGKGPSIWDEFCRVPGAIADGSNGDVACDHYHRLESDLDLIAHLGVRAYRFSISWPRIQPAGSGAVNEAGIAFYERLVDGLLARNIQPYATLYHWDLPAELQRRHGGWLARETAGRFADYARVVAERLHTRPGDRKPIRAHSEIREQIQIRLQPMVVIARNIAVAPIGDSAGHAAEIVPDRRAAATRARTTLDLKRARSHSPHEIFRKTLAQLADRQRAFHRRPGFGAALDSRTMSSTGGSDVRGRSFFNICNMASAELSPRLRTA